MADTKQARGYMKGLDVGDQRTLSRLALGCYALGGGYGDLDESTVGATIDAALESGWTFFDTAEGYLESEARLGRILGPRRDEVFLATKVFPCEPYTYANMRRSLDNSLRKLQTDRVDLFQLHGPQSWVIDFADAPSMSEIGAALHRLLDSGDVLNVGVCNLPRPQMEELSAAVPLFSTQNLYSMLDQHGGDDGVHLPVGQSIIPWARHNDIRVLAFSPLARGLLADGLAPNRTFTADDERYFLPRFQPEVFPDWARLANRLEQWANARDRTLVQLAIAWVLATPGVSSVLIGAKRPEHVAAFAGAADWDLTEEDLSELADLIDQLPPGAATAKSIVWDHFPPDAVREMASRRHAPATAEGEGQAS